MQFQNTGLLLVGAASTVPTRQQTHILRMRNYRVPGSDMLPIGGLYGLPIFSETIQF